MAEMATRRGAVRELTHGFDLGRVMRRVVELVAEEADRRLVWSDGRTDLEAPEFEALEEDVRAVGSYLRGLWHAGAYVRDGSLDAWFAAGELPFDALLRLGRAARDAARAAEAARSPEEAERLDVEADRREREWERVREAMEDGLYRIGGQCSSQNAQRLAGGEGRQRAKRAPLPPFC